MSKGGFVLSWNSNGWGAIEFVAQLVRHSNVCARILHKTQKYV